MVIVVLHLGAWTLRADKRDWNPASVTRHPWGFGPLNLLEFILQWSQGDSAWRAQIPALAHSRCTLIRGPPFSPDLMARNPQWCSISTQSSLNWRGYHKFRVRLPCTSPLVFPRTPSSSLPPRMLPAPPPKKCKAHLLEIVCKGVRVPGQDL